MSEKMVRPVRCFFCSKPMFYSGDSRHEPEVFVSASSDNRNVIEPECFYAHLKCWNTLIHRRLPKKKENRNGK